MNPEFKTKIGDSSIAFWYNTKTHQYHIVADVIAEELIISKAKAEAVIKFLKWAKGDLVG